MTYTDVSVVIPSHDENRFHRLSRTVASALAQVPTPAEVIVVVDHNDRLHARVRRELPGVTVLHNQYDRGVSGTRNTGALHTTTSLIAFLDDDTEATDGWLAALIAPLADPRVVGTGGAIRPNWEREPAWVPAEFLWAFGASHAGLPTTTAVVRNVWSASMAVRRDVFEAVGGFRLGFGKLGARSRPEDTELCLRMAEKVDGDWVYVPSALIHHAVPLDRANLRYFLRRCFNEGAGKVEMARLAGHAPGGRRLASERTYAWSLPRAVGRGLADTVSGRDRSGAARAGAIVAGAAAAGVGAAAALVRLTPA